MYRDDCEMRRLSLILCIGGQFCGFLYKGNNWTEPGEVTEENPGGRVLSMKYDTLVNGQNRQ
mgnify:CR=1 FL=1